MTSRSYYYYMPANVGGIWYSLLFTHFSEVLSFQRFCVAEGYDLGKVEILDREKALEALDNGN